MEDVLKQLLEAEIKAEALVDEAKAKNEQVQRQVLEEARAAEERLEARLPDIRASFLEKSEERASHTIAELTRRYEERQRQLHDIAQEHLSEAGDAALALLLDTERP